MRLPGRAQRRVYEVFDEATFLANPICDRREQTAGASIGSARERTARYLLPALLAATVAGTLALLVHGLHAGLGTPRVRLGSRRVSAARSGVPAKPRRFPNAPDPRAVRQRRHGRRSERPVPPRAPGISLAESQAGSSAAGHGAIGATGREFGFER